MLAERVERDVLDDHHLAVVDVEDRAVDEALGIDVVAGRELRVHPVDALGRAAQTLAVGILADLDEDLADGRLDPPVRGPGPAGGDRRAVPSIGRSASPSIERTASNGVSPISDSISVTSCWRWAGRSGIVRLIVPRPRSAADAGVPAWSSSPTASGPSSSRRRGSRRRPRRDGSASGRGRRPGNRRMRGRRRRAAGAAPPGGRQASAHGCPSLVVGRGEDRDRAHRPTPQGRDGVVREHRRHRSDHARGRGSPARRAPPEARRRQPGPPAPGRHPTSPGRRRARSAR